ncbi:MAG: phosphate acyltransferase PlsX [Rikenellaceae bacterium]|nr:phosphate acyltransferase PlsX [Rikenellaceae bacterium]
MGGDYAPQAAVLGAIEALGYIGNDTRITLFGDREKITEILRQEGSSADSFDIVHTSQVIEMGEHPAHAFTWKPDSSIVVGFQYLKAGKIDGFASAGSTGAMMVGSSMVIKQIEGIIRPAICTQIPTEDGGCSVLLDVGLNVDCKPDVLFQYGLIGSIYAQSILGLENPRVALMNIGQEAEKGNLAAKAAYETMDGTESFRFVGNVEAHHLFDKKIADVIVCDGFVGNVMIKQAEGFYSLMKQQGVTSPFIEALNYEEIGGTPVLGINSTVIIGHGHSSPKAIRNMILHTETAVKAGIVEKFKEAFK